jgi:hypothetical protein
MASQMASTSAAASFYPSPSEAALKLQFINKTIGEVQSPAAIVDAAVIRSNCGMMIDATAHFGLGFRAHVKTHKVYADFIILVLVEALHLNGMRRQHRWRPSRLVAYL